MTRQDILANIDAPRQLEKLYRENKLVFKTEFNSIYPELKDYKVAEYWNERLNYESSEISWGSKAEMTYVIIISLIAGLIAKIPAIFNINEEYFYQRNIGFIVFPMLSAYFISQRNLSTKKTIMIGIIFLISLMFINFFPDNKDSNTLILSCIHLVLLQWSILGFTFIGEFPNDYRHRLDFLRYNGELVIMTTLILISGGILTGITIGLFSMIGFNIEKFYFENIVIFGLAAAPVFGTYITQSNPQLVNKVSPVIAKIFSPLVLITLVAYLVAIIYSGKDPYNDREFLLIFNLLLIGVMAIIFFSISETSKKKNKTDSIILLALSVVTIIVNSIALSAILFRIAEWGITPNRLAVLGGNVLILINLLLVSYHLIRNVSGKSDLKGVENSISGFLPVYVAWTIIVTFVFPFIFHFK